MLHQGNLAHMSNFSYFIFANIFWKKLSINGVLALHGIASECEWGDAVWCAVNGHNLVAAVISDTMPPIDTAN